MAIVQIKLKGLKVTENGSLSKSVPAGLAVSLFYPRPGFPLIVAARDLGKLADKLSVDYTGNNPDTGKPFSWAELVLFKEEIVGQAYLAANVAIGPSKLSKFLSGMLKGLFGAAAGTLASPYAAVASQAVIAEMFGPDDKAPSESVASGGVLLDPAALPDVLSIELRAPSAITQRGAVMENGELVEKDIEVLKKGAANGKLELVVEVL